MKKVLYGSLVLALGVALVSSAAFAKTGNGGYASYERTSELSNTVYGLDNFPRANRGGFASAVATTLTLGSWKFESGTTCTTQGWTTADITDQSTSSYWHVDDFAGIPPTTKADIDVSFNAFNGSKALWLGVEDPIAFCSYGTLPGYGNNWDQVWCLKNCISLGTYPDTTLSMSYGIKFSSEDQWDGTQVEYTTDCTGASGWTKFAGGIKGAGAYTASDSFLVNATYVLAGNPASVKVRFHFTSDSNTSSEDALWNGLATIVDDLQIESLGPETFEDEAAGAIASNDWAACQQTGYGTYFALFKKANARHQDLCLDNLSCYWASIQGSTDLYNCGPNPDPTQKVVPYMNAKGQYINNEIWSPYIPLVGTGNDYRFRFMVYQDLPLDNLVLWVWHIRSITAGCPALWRDRQFVHYGDNRDWAEADLAVGTVLNTAGASHIQVALGVLDACEFWCGQVGTGACHTPAPYFDSVKVLRINTFGPAFDVRSLDMFQDNFAENGTLTGTARADMANDVRPGSNPAIVPGDSALVLYIIDPVYSPGPFYLNASGLLPDGTSSTFIGRNKVKRQVYCWVAVWPLDLVDGPGDKVGEDLSEGPGGTANRYPFAGTQTVNGVLWTKIRFDYTYNGTPTTPGWGTGTQARLDYRFNVDLNDNLFEPCDTVCFFFSATSSAGTTYWSPAWGASQSLTEIAANPGEFTILPAGGWKRGGDILYVDGADGSGHQAYWDGAFMVLGLLDKVDRYDIRAPSSGVSNRPSSRVKNVLVQLNGCYRKILWDCAGQSTTLGDGTGWQSTNPGPEKTDDYAMLNLFLGNLTNNGGVYLSGDRVGQYLDQYLGTEAANFQGTYMPFVLTDLDHRTYPGVNQVSPAIKAWPLRCFSDDAFVYGGCAQLNDFDVFAPAGSSQIEMSYQTAMDPDGAVISNVNGFAHVMLSGFGFGYLRDDELNGVSDHAQFLHDIIVWLGNPLNQPTGAGPELKNELSQNYPNPFNPQTTIAFSIKERGNVSLKVYNVAGQLVRTLANENRAAGPYTLTWDGKNDAGQPVSSGVYFYKLVANNFSQTKKMVLLK